jgi:hypothetical protein
MRGTGIALGSDYDVKVIITKNAQGLITKGLRLEETLPQNQAVILLAQLGDLKENPAQGVGLGNMINDNDLLGWQRRIIMQMQFDKQVVRTVNFKNGKLKIDANYAS